MTSHCTKCGIQLPDDSELCWECSLLRADDFELSEKTPADKGFQKNGLNVPKTGRGQSNIKSCLTRHNRQRKFVRMSLLLSCISAALTCLSIWKGNPLYGEYYLTLTGLFGTLGGLVVALLFAGRAKRLNALIHDNNTLAAWRMTDHQKAEYANFLYRHEIAKNAGVLFITTLLIILIFGAFIVFIDEGKGAMAMVMLGITAFVAIFALGMPAYYRLKNRQGDGVVLIGKNCAYVNGVFHNWDFPLSGLRRVKIIDRPFRGLYIQYFYVDRTFKNTEQLYIPAPSGLDLNEVVSELKKK